MKRPFHPLHDPAGAAQARTPPRAALRVSLIYALVGGAWIVISDYIVDLLISPATAERYHVQTFKGWLFIGVTAGILYVLIRRTFGAMRVSERARRETEARTRLLVERVRDYAIFTLDSSGNVTSWNRGAQQITDWVEQDVIGKHYSIFYTKADVEADKPRGDLEASRQQGWFEEEALRVRQDGSQFWANVQLTALRDESGSAAGFLNVIRDVTERRRAQEVLQQINAFLAAVIEASPLAIVTLNLKGEVQAWNPAAERLFGWTQDEIIGKLLPILTPEQTPSFEEIVRDTDTREHPEGVELQRVRKDGARLELALWTAPLRDPGGTIIGSIRIFADVSERKRAEQQIRTLNETLERRVAERTAQLEETNEELQAFSYTVSHDLRVPLRSLQHLARELLETQTEKLDETGRADALRIVGAAARMERLIEDVLEFSRISRGELKLEPVSLVLIVHELVGRLERDPELRDAQVVVEEPLGWVRGNPLILQQVILNLLLNAITFVRPGARPSVRVRAEERDGWIRLCVEDNGIGISPADRERVFQLFERLPDAAKFPGSGLGLSVARRGIQRMGGHIGLDSNQSGGSVFWIELPKIVGSM